jgi:hypothetical protein
VIGQKRAALARHPWESPGIEPIVSAENRFISRSALDSDEQQLSPALSVWPELAEIVGIKVSPRRFRPSATYQKGFLIYG